jgi:phage regulator Rha-like protein
MNQLINLQNKVLTMSSREIAELTNKEHRNVKRDIKNMLEQLNISVLSFEQTYKDVQNKQQVEYLLPKKYIECLLTGYSIPLR